jgi:ectoine hydroxylase-related dioxygenase (phytanoyl-CoA dioxygenase family)
MKLTDAEKASGALSPERLQEAVQTFNDVGYVVIEDAYDLAFLETVRVAYEVELERFIASKGGLAALEGKTFGKNHIGFFPPLNLPLADSQLAAQPVAVQLMKALLGDDLQCAFFHTNTALPGSGIQPVHRDTAHLMGVPHPVATLVLNIPLCDFTIANGATEVWPGSHLTLGTVDNDRAAAFPSARTEVPVGSFILRDMRMWHRGMPNDADYPRTMYAIVYERGFLRTPTITVPKTTWESWSEDARHIFRHNQVVDDEAHSPRVWGS